MTQLRADLDQVRSWLEYLYAGHPGRLHVCAMGDWSGQTFEDDIDAAVAYVARKDAEGASGIYARVTTVRRRLLPGERGGETDSFTLPGLWADVDIAGPGHKVTARMTLPGDMETAMRMISESGLPEPSAWVHSGGGLYPWWLLESPVEINASNFNQIKQLSQHWQDAIAVHAASMGLHYGSGVGDLARVLRIPGTINRKVDGDPRKCQVLSQKLVGYQIRDLELAVTAFRAEHAPEERPVVSIAPRTRRSDELLPGDDFEARTDWSDPLLLGDWSEAYQRGDTTYWIRPGKTTDGISATTGHAADRNRLYVFSDATEFEPNRPYTKFQAYARLHHNDDWTAAATKLASLNFGTRSPGEPPLSALLGTPMPQVEPELKPIPTASSEGMSSDWAEFLAYTRHDTEEEPTQVVDEDDWFKEDIRPVPDTERPAQEPVEPVNQAAEGDRLRLTPASAFKIKAVKWVWQDRIPRGEITLIPGREGVGKSIFLAKMAADITKGTLEGCFFGIPKGVVYCATEDSWNHTIAPRLLAAGANMDMVFRCDINPETGEAGAPILPNDCDELARAMVANNIGVLMLDPIVSMINDNLSTNKAPQLRKALEPLRRCAEAANVAVMALAHFNKSNASDVSSQVAGSRAWLEVSRAALSIARMENEQDDDDAQSFMAPRYTCVVTQEKNNLGRLDLPSKTYTIASVEIPTDDGEMASVGVMTWGEDTTTTVEEILAAQRDGRRGMGDSKKQILAFVREQFKETGMRSSPKEIAEELGLTLGNVRVTLSRLVKDGKLTNPARGMYQPAETIKATVVGEIDEVPRAGIERSAGSDDDRIHHSPQTSDGESGVRRGGTGQRSDDRGWQWSHPYQSADEHRR